jgi:riboflavin-specific deaminase-like protein
VSFQADQPAGANEALQGACATDEHCSAEERAWRLAHAAARGLGERPCFDTSQPGGFRLGADAQLCRVDPDDAQAELRWHPGKGWECTAALNPAMCALLELYLPVSSASAEAPITIAHLGQSLDGFIATPSGDSAFVTGPENILHLHRLRALCDAVIVGASTVHADNPRLTTRLVAGSNPVRVVLDPACRLPATHSVFSDHEATTLRVCAAEGLGELAPLATAEQRLKVPTDRDGLDLRELLRQLHARGHYRVLIEGGGVTVSSFLHAGLLDRLHIAIAAVLIGDGRPAVRLPPRVRLQDCLRLQHRVYRTGSDILFDCDLRARAHGPEPMEPGHSIQRIL